MTSKTYRSTENIKQIHSNSSNPKSRLLLRESVSLRQHFQQFLKALTEALMMRVSPFLVNILWEGSGATLRTRWCLIIRAEIRLSSVSCNSTMLRKETRSRERERKRERGAWGKTTTAPREEGAARKLVEWIGAKHWITSLAEENRHERAFDRIGDLMENIAKRLKTQQNMSIGELFDQAHLQIKRTFIW